MDSKLMMMMMTMKNKGQCAREEMLDCIRRREYMMPCNMRAMKNL
jgi:hypothetical protein